MPSFYLFDNFWPLLDFDHFLDHVFVGNYFLYLIAFEDRLHIVFRNFVLIKIFDPKPAEPRKSAIAKLRQSVIITEKQDRMIGKTDIIGNVIGMARFPG